MNYRNNASRMLPLMAFAAMAFATSCSNDSIADGGNQTPGGGKGKTVELTASFDNNKGAATRVGMTKIDDSNASLYWHNGDAITVQIGSECAKFTTSATTGSTTATFTGDIADGSTLGTYAVYPYNENNHFNDDQLAYILPNEYKYTEVASNVFSTTGDDGTTYPTNSCNIPMVGKIENGNITTFKHIGGLAVIRIDNMPVAEGTLTIKANEQLSGEFIVDLSTDEPKLETASEDITETSQRVTFNFCKATKGGAGVFYLPLATGDYTGVTITLSNADGSSPYSVNYDDLSVTRANVTAIPLYNNNGTIEKK